MEKKYQIAFVHQDEEIDWKSSETPLIIPNVGESIAILSWENDNNSQGRNWWVVTEIKHIIWANPENKEVKQKVMIEIIPDMKNGLWKSDIEYESFHYEKS